MNRSATTELDLEAGRYLVMIKIIAWRDKARTRPEEVVKKVCETRPEKLMAVGLSYDLAHAKGHLKDSELEHKERLRKDRREKRRRKAINIFEAQRKLDKKEKLRRLRLEAKEKAKRGTDYRDNPDIDNGVEISIKVGESTLKPTKRQTADDAVNGTRVVSQGGSSKQLKITVEASDKVEGNKVEGNKVEGTKGGEQQAEDAKQALEGTKGEYEGKGEKDEGTATSMNSTFGATPARSAESSAAIEGSDKAEENAVTVTGEKFLESKITTEIGEGTGGSADQSNVAETDIMFRNLTLDNISDDGLSWNSDIDAPSDSPSEIGSDSDSNSDSNTDEPAPSPTKNQIADDPTNDPWNAVCVFGLRVYSKGSQAEIEVVRKQDGGGSIESKKLDVDDRAADATKKLQKGSASEEEQLETVGTAPAWDEDSKQG